jgi:hypothetical protein
MMKRLAAKKVMGEGLRSGIFSWEEHLSYMAGIWNCDFRQRTNGINEIFH